MKIRTDFPGGNGTGFEWAAPDRLRLEADMRGGPYSMWFHFVVEEPECDVLCCELVNGKTALGWPYGPTVRPVYRHPGGDWQRVPPTTVDAEAGLFSFQVACRKMTTEIAFCYPYQLGDWQRFFESELASLGARIVELGRSAGGNRLFACECGGGPVGVWLTARHHSGETPGSYSLEGLFTGLLAQEPEGLTVRAIPFVDADGVVSGMYGKERPPVDFNRAWGGDTKRPEIETYKRYLSSLPKGPAVAVDSHAPCATDPHFIAYDFIQGPDPELPRRIEGLVARVTAECGREPDTALSEERGGLHPSWYPQGYDRCVSGFLQATFGTCAFTLESSYHATHTGLTVGPGTWRGLGGAVARGIIEFLREENVL